MRKSGQRRLSIDEIRQIDLVDYLAALGFSAAYVRKGENEHWYHSPLHEDKTPSFKVDRRLNCWYDHSEKRGGNTIDFGMVFFSCTIGEFLRRINDGEGLRLPRIATVAGDKLALVDEHKLTVHSVADLSSSHLVSFLHERMIPLSIARKFCCEVDYETTGGIFKAIGFKNDADGYELRSRNYKLSSTPKDVTTLVNGSETVHVFEGFADFLSFQTFFQKQPEMQHDFIILNSVGFLEKARGFLEQHASIRL